MCLAILQLCRLHGILYKNLYSRASISVASSFRSSVEKCKALVKSKPTEIEAKQAEERVKEEAARRSQEIQHAQGP